MTPLAILKKVRRGLTPKKNFDGRYPATNRPHCVFGEWNMVTKSMTRKIYHNEIFSFDEASEFMMPNLTHSRALAILDAAIARQAKKEAHGHA